MDIGDLTTLIVDCTDKYISTWAYAFDFSPFSFFSFFTPANEKFSPLAFSNLSFFMVPSFFGQELWRVATAAMASSTDANSTTAIVYPVIGFSLSSGRLLPSIDLTVYPDSMICFLTISILPSGMLETITEALNFLSLLIQIFLNLESLFAENLQFSLAWRTSLDFVSSFLMPALSILVKLTLIAWPSSFLPLKLATAFTALRESSNSIKAPSGFFSENTIFLTFPKLPNMFSNLSASWYSSAIPVTHTQRPRSCTSPVRVLSKLATFELSKVGLPGPFPPLFCIPRLGVLLAFNRFIIPIMLEFIPIGRVCAMFDIFI